MEDEHIVNLYWQRNERAIDETRQKYSQYCYCIAYNILQSREDAQECENDTYLAAWNAIPPHRPALLSTFLGKLTRRISLDRWRSNNAAKRGGDALTVSLDELRSCIPDGQTFSDTLEARELGRSISRFLRQLSSRDRLIFIRRYWYCDSVAQIAAHLACGESKIKMILLRTRTKLQKHLRKEGIL